MSDEVCGNRQTSTTINGRAVTACTSALWPRGAIHVLSVVKPDVELLLEARREIS
jgi:hypothetical protein